MTQANDFTTEGDFRRAVKTVLHALLDQVDDIDSDDHDPTLTDGNLKIVFEDGSTFILSQQPPTREFWLSANFTAWHFVRTEGVWLERDSGERMLDVLSSLFSDKLSMTIRFSL
jgi:iron donor protein CyaY